MRGMSNGCVYVANNANNAIYSTLKAAYRIDGPCLRLVSVDLDSHGCSGVKIERHRERLGRATKCLLSTARVEEFPDGWSTQVQWNLYDNDTQK